RRVALRKGQGHMSRDNGNEGRVPTTDVAGRGPGQGRRTMSVRRGLGAATLLAGVLGLAACGGDEGAAGTYVHEEEGTIVLEGDGTGTWTQSGDPLEFTWEQDGATITLQAGDSAAEVELVDGDLVIPPEFISGDDP